jgi:DNA-binding PadR family transcriptional regulator
MKPSILLALLENFPLYFQEITDICESNRNRCRKKLNLLKKKGFINESAHKQGQKAFFSLTEKGRSEALKEVGNALKNNYRILKFDLENTFTPKMLNHIRREASLHPKEKEIESGSIGQKRQKEMIAQREKVLAPIHNLFFELAQYVCKVDGRLGVQENLDNIAFWFEEGKMHFIVLRDKENVRNFIAGIKSQ